MQLSTKVFSVFASIALFAIPAMANDSGPQPGDTACGTLDPQPQENTLQAAEQCSCSGGISLTITAVGGYTAKPGSLVCESVNIKNAYDGYKAGGNTLLQYVKFVNHERIDRSCDTSDCWDILIAWGGTPKCKENHIILQGGGGHYIAVGNCPETPASDADKDKAGEGNGDGESDAEPQG